MLSAEGWVVPTVHTHQDVAWTAAAALCSETSNQTLRATRTAATAAAAAAAAAAVTLEGSGL